MLFGKLRRSYNAKLIVVFTVLNLISVMFSGMMYYIMLENVIYNNYSSVVEDTGKQIYSEISRRMEEIQRVSHTFIFDQSLHLTLRKYFEGYERQTVLTDYLLHKGNTALVLTNMNTSIKLYINNESVPEYYYNSEQPNKKKFEVLHTSRIEKEEYYRNLLQLKGFESWQQVGDDAVNGRISLLVRLIDFSTMKDSGILRITMSLDELFGNVFPESFLQEAFYHITDGNNNIIYSNADPLESEERFETVTQQIDKFVIDLRMPFSNINKGVNASLFQLSFILCGCFLLTFIIALIFCRILYSNVNKISDGIKEFKNGNYKYNIEISGGDEFNQIATSLNGFAHSVDHLVNDVYEVMIQKQDAELQMLQAKINPHFMYNIFSIISQLAAAGKNDEIVKMVDMTSKFYRSALSKSTKNNNLADELRILDDYFNIINIQRKDAVKKIYEIDEKTLDCLIPNFILQPIVENSIKHAMIDGHITITIRSVFEEKDVVITIQDNGIGMTEEQLEQLFKFKPNSGYGLYNINERIRMRYHDPRHTLTCKSVYGEGTEVMLRLPFLTQEDGEEVEDV